MFKSLIFNDLTMIACAIGYFMLRNVVCFPLARMRLLLFIHYVFIGLRCILNLSVIVH